MFAASCIKDMLLISHISKSVLSSTYLCRGTGVDKSCIYILDHLGPQIVPCRIPPLGWPVYVQSNPPPPPPKTVNNAGPNCHNEMLAVANQSSLPGMHNQTQYWNWTQNVHWEYVIMSLVSWALIECLKEQVIPRIIEQRHCSWPLIRQGTMLVKLVGRPEAKSVQLQ